MTKTKDIGLEAKKPGNSCDSEKCPWHGHLKVRGRIFTGKVVSSKPANTVIVSWNYYKYVPKYERYERRKTKIESHNPRCIDAKAGEFEISLDSERARLLLIEPETGKDRQ